MSQKWEKRLQAQNRYLSSIFDLSYLISAEDPKETYQNVLEDALQILDCQAAAIQLLSKDEQGNEVLELEASIGFPYNYENQIHHLPMDSDDPAIQCFRECKPVQTTKRRSASLVNEQSMRHYFHPLFQASKLCLPIHRQNNVLGVITFYCKRGNSFTVSIVNMGQAIARFLAVPLLHRQEFIRREHELTALLDLSRQLSVEVDMQRLLRLAVTMVRKWMNAEVVSIFFEESDVLRRAAIAGMEPVWFPEEEYQVGLGLTGKAITITSDSRSDRVICENYVITSPDVAYENVKRYCSDLSSRKLSHLLVVPLDGRQGPIGALRLVNKLTGAGSLSTQGFNDWDCKLLLSLACQITLAIESNRNVSLVRQQFAILNRLEAGSVAIASSMPVENVLRQLVDLSSKLVGAAFGGITILDDQGQLVTSYENYPDIQPLHIRARPNGKTKYIIRTRQPILVNNAQPGDDHNPILIKIQVRSYAGLPIIENDELLGVLFVHSFSPNAFKDTMTALTTFANYAAIAIRDSHQFQYLRKFVERMTALYDITLDIAAQLNYKDLLRNITHGTVNLLDVDTSGLFLYDPTFQVMRLVVDHLDPAFEGYDHAINIGFVGEVFQSGEPQTAKHCTLWPRQLAENKERVLQTVVAVPIKWKGSVVGVLYAGELENNRTFDDVDIKLLQLIANYGAIVLDRIQRFERIYKEKNVLQQYLMILQESRTQIANPDVTSLLVFVADSGAHLLHAEDCSLYLVTDKDEIVLAASNRVDPKLWGRNKTPVTDTAGAGLTAFVAATGQILRFKGDAYRKHPAWSGEFVEHLHSFKSGKSQSLLIVPILSTNERTIGVLKVENKQGFEAGSGFTEVDEDLLVNLARQVAISIEVIEQEKAFGDFAAKKERFRLRDELHETLNVLRTGVKWRVEAAQAWLNKQELNQAKRELDSSVAALNHLSEVIQYIMDDLDYPILKQEGLEAALEHFGQGMAKPVEIIGHNSNRFNPALELAVYRICQEGLHNAWKHSPTGDGRHFSVKVILREENNQLTITVADNGCGFDVRSEVSDNAMGLKRMQQWADDEGIPLALESRIDRGTRIVIGPVSLV